MKNDIFITTAKVEAILAALFHSQDIRGMKKYLFIHRSKSSSFKNFQSYPMKCLFQIGFNKVQFQVFTKTKFHCISSIKVMLVLIYLSVYLTACLSVCLSVFLSINMYLHVVGFIYLYMVGHSYTYLCAIISLENYQGTKKQKQLL